MTAFNKTLFPALALCAASVMMAAESQTRFTDRTLWYDSQAHQWEETLPLGNGRLGMMPDGGVDKEKIVLNEISMWSGSEADYSNPEASKCLPDIQRLLKEGRNKEAQEMMYDHFVPSAPQKGDTYGRYQMLADLNIDYNYSGDFAPAGYRRWLDLSQATAYTAFTCGDVDYLRKYFVPRGYDMMVMKVSADTKAKVNFTLEISRKEAVDSVRYYPDGVISVWGHLDSGKEGVNGVGFEIALRTIVTGAESKLEVGKSRIMVADADEAWVVVSASTDYWPRIGVKDIPDPVAVVAAATPESLEDAHREGTANFRQLYGRAGVNFAHTAQSELPTDRRIEAFATGDDPELAALYYNYGRYLLISSTCPGLLPPNLQGLWANDVATPWNGDYHTNINVQMNHWPVEQGNLSELHGPLIDLVERAVPSGQRTAKAFYGPDAKGWVMHMMTNVWEYTAPGAHPSWGATNTGGAWLTAHLWEHHLFNPADTAYLRKIYPVLKGASQFFLTTMIEEPENGWLVTAPSSSPENMFKVGDADVSVCMGPTMDTQIVHELFSNVVTASDALGVDRQYADSLRAAIEKLPPMQMGSDGRLMEWLEEYTETDPHHRHVSHLYGLHPANLISPEKTPELARAARKTLEARGDGGTGWSRAWKINFWARLGDGDRAYKLFKGLLTPAYTKDKPKHGPGTFPNLFCSHAPFQMDGNWGGTSGISEMLLQSQDGYINVLPALPSALADGSLFGFKTRGGATVNLVWEDKVPTLMEINTPVAQKIKVPVGIRYARVNGKPVVVGAAGGYIDVAPGETKIQFESRR